MVMFLEIKVKYKIFSVKCILVISQIFVLLSPVSKCTLKPRCGVFVLRQQLPTNSNYSMLQFRPICIRMRHTLLKFCSTGQSAGVKDGSLNSHSQSLQPECLQLLLFGLSIWFKHVKQEPGRNCSWTLLLWTPIFSSVILWLQELLSQTPVLSRHLSFSF